MAKYNFEHLSNEQLLDAMEKSAFMVCHKETKRRLEDLAAVKAEILRRMNSASEKAADAGQRV